MRCSKCGTRFGQSDVFCPECGIRVSGQSEAPIAAEPVADAPTTPDKPPAPEARPEEVGSTEAQVASEPVKDKNAGAQGRLPAPPHSASSKPGEAPRKSAFAVAALVLGIGAFTFLPVLGALLAIIFGGIAKGTIKRGKGTLKGGGMANAGLVLGIIGLVIPVVLAAVIVPLGVVYLMPGFTAGDHLLRGVDASRIYYNENGSYAGLDATALADIDDTIGFRMATGRKADVVYVDKVAANTVRLYCYSTRGEKFIASATGQTWLYSFGWHWGPFNIHRMGTEWDTW